MAWIAEITQDVSASLCTIDSVGIHPMDAKWACTCLYHVYKHAPRMSYRNNTALQDIARAGSHSHLAKRHPGRSLPFSWPNPKTNVVGSCRKGSVASSCFQGAFSQVFGNNWNHQPSISFYDLPKLSNAFKNSQTPPRCEHWEHPQEAGRATRQWSLSNFMLQICIITGCFMPLETHRP